MTDEMRKEKLDYIKANVCKKELLAQLAEEATELAQAALKCRRTFDNTNPTPTSKAKALGNLIEEIDDVGLLLDSLTLKWRIVSGGAGRDKKLERWVKRLKAIKKGDVDNAGR